MRYLSTIISFCIWMIVLTLALMAGFGSGKAVLITISLSIAEAISIYLNRKKLIDAFEDLEKILG